MATRNVLVQIEMIESQERLLSGMQQSAAKSLQQERETRGLSLRDVAPHVGLTGQGLLNIESGKSWRTGTARRVAEFYNTQEAA